MAKAILSKAETCVLYLRMSHEKQDTSIEDQRFNLTKYAEKHGYKIFREYLDEAISGDATEKRTGFLAMREAVGSGEFAVILCWDQDRFGRFDPLDAGYWIYPFRQNAIRLETIAQGKIDWEDLTGQLIYSVNQIGKAQFLRDIGRNTARGLLAAARNGTAGTGGPSCYGYRSKDGVVLIVEDEARVVRWIFAEYLKPGASLRGIAVELNRRKIPPPRGPVWRSSSVRAILQRRKYTGSFIYGASNAGKYFSMRNGEVIPRRKSDKTISAEPIIHENKFEAIVPQMTFDKVQNKLADRKGNTSTKQARRYLLAGLAKCGDCNGAMGGITNSTKPVYHCRRYHAAGNTACHRNVVEEAPLVAAIVRKIQEEYLSDSALARLRRSLEAGQDQAGPRPEDLTLLRREIGDLDRKIDQGAARALEAPTDLVPILYRKLDAWRGDRDRLKTELDALASRQATPDRKDGSEVDETIDTLRDLSKAFRDAEPEDIRELLSSIVTRIELHFNHETTSGGREQNVFAYGTIHVRPDAGEVRSTGTDSSHLITNRSFLDARPFGSILRLNSRDKTFRDPPSRKSKCDIAVGIEVSNDEGTDTSRMGTILFGPQARHDANVAGSSGCRWLRAGRTGPAEGARRVDLNAGLGPCAYSPNPRRQGQRAQTRRPTKAALAGGGWGCPGQGGLLAPNGTANGTGHQNLFAFTPCFSGSKGPIMGEITPREQRGNSIWGLLIRWSRVRVPTAPLARNAHKPHVFSSLRTFLRFLIDGHYCFTMVCFGLIYAPGAHRMRTRLPAATTHAPETSDWKAGRRSRPAVTAGRPEGSIDRRGWRTRREPQIDDLGLGRHLIPLAPRTPFLPRAASARVTFIGLALPTRAHRPWCRRRNDSVTRPGQQLGRRRSRICCEPTRWLKL